LNANEDGENILGYDLYSSALADILTEPALTMPITVGLYAKWGSGKSFLLGKLRDEMLSFTREWIVEPVINLHFRFEKKITFFHGQLIGVHMQWQVPPLPWILKDKYFSMLFQVS
jgi:ankyrin repeat-rich membrane spanning protein